jgi:hypothetical protein
MHHLGQTGSRCFCQHSADFRPISVQLRACRVTLHINQRRQPSHENLESCDVSISIGDFILSVLNALLSETFKLELTLVAGLNP